MSKVLKGTERRELQEHIAIGRAEFEIEYEGKQIQPFNREYFVTALPLKYRDPDTGFITINVTDSLIEGSQRKVEYWKRAIRESVR